MQPTMTMQSKTAQSPASTMEFQTRLLNWYDESKRNLPWRVNATPYSIWISEIMAQQTRISALLPYYTRFMKQFPTVFDLASASEDDVLKAWEGLGYYSRARNLHQAAKIIAWEHDGNLPRDRKGLLALPGIGTYTAGAILSIAYDIPTPAVDGNVLRVFSRLENSSEDIGLPKTKEHVTKWVAKHMPRNRPGCFTQALMELGALICIPKNPPCKSCPLDCLCLAYKHGRQTELPVKSKPNEKKIVPQTIFVICLPDGRIVMGKRHEKLLKGLWEFYRIAERLDELAASKHLESLGYTIQSVKSLGQVKHVFTHMIWEMDGFLCHVSEKHAPEGYSLLSPAEAKEQAIPTAIRPYVQRSLIL